MEIVPLPGAADAAALAADTIEALVGDRPGSVLGLATGSSPLVVYAELIRRSIAARRGGPRRCSSGFASLCDEKSAQFAARRLAGRCGARRDPSGSCAASRFLQPRRLRTQPPFL